MATKMDALIKEMNKNAKEDVMFKGLAHYNYERIPATSPRMNFCIHGGIPEERLTELYGPEGGGKTTTALDIVANFQARERQRHEEDEKYVEKSVFYADVENTLDAEWAETLGVDLDSMYLFQPKEKQSAEDILKLIKESVKTSEIGLFVIDSIGAMLSAQELDEKRDYTDKVYGGISLALTRFSNEITSLLTKYHCTGIAINQERDDMNSTWGGTRTPGGKAWKYACSLRIRLFQGSFIDEDGKEISRGAESPAGIKIQFSITKIKSGSPNRKTGFYTLRFADGIDYLSDLIEMAIREDINVIEKSGGWFTVPGVEKAIQGQANVYKYLEEHEDILQRVEDMVNEAME